MCVEGKARVVFAAVWHVAIKEKSERNSLTKIVLTQWNLKKKEKRFMFGSKLYQREKPFSATSYELIFM